MRPRATDPRLGLAVAGQVEGREVGWKTLLLVPRRPMGTLEPVPDCAVVVGGELEQSPEEEGRTGAASDIVKVKDWVQPF